MIRSFPRPHSFSSPICLFLIFFFFLPFYVASKPHPNSNIEPDPSSYILHEEKVQFDREQIPFSAFTDSYFNVHARSKEVQDHLEPASSPASSWSRSKTPTQTQFPPSIPLNITLNPSWECLGPFPAGTREQSLLSNPIYAFLGPRMRERERYRKEELRESWNRDAAFAALPFSSSDSSPTSEEEKWPSTLGPNGTVSWSRVLTSLTNDDKDTPGRGFTEIKYPSIPWDLYRSHSGWSALQYQVLLRNSLNVSFLVPKSRSISERSPNRVPSHIRVELLAGQEFAFVPTGIDPRKSEATEWYNGDIYSFGASYPPHSYERVQGVELERFEEMKKRDERDERSTSVFAHLVQLPSGYQTCESKMVTGIEGRQQEEAEYWDCKWEYTVLVRALYDVRVFNDPGAGDKDGPKIRFKLGIEGTASAAATELQEPQEAIEVLPELALIGNLVDGWIWGEYLGIGLRAFGGSYQIVTVQMDENQLELQGVLKATLATKRCFLLLGNSKITPISIKQKQPIPNEVKFIKLKLGYRLKCDQHNYSNTTEWMNVQVPLKHIPSRLSSGVRSPKTPSNADDAIKYTYLGPTHAVTYAILIPPFSQEPYSAKMADATLLALHGAGVHADASMWINAIPRQKRGWAVLPTGGTEWGMDWHGISADDARMALHAARQVVGNIGGKKWNSFTDETVRRDEDGWFISNKTILMGHSNGGQGAWHIAARYPDEFIAVVPAAGYLKIQDYVNYNAWTSDHYADPILMGILMASLSPFDNDLYASNLVDVPILALHGRNDDNVPVWHSRQHLELVQGWAESRNATRYHETPKQLHWWDEIFLNTHVKSFIVGTSSSSPLAHISNFTLTTANPAESGPKHGIRILQLEIPGRLGRLAVEFSNASSLTLRTSNLDSFSVSSTILNNLSRLRINGKVVELPVRQNTMEHAVFAKNNAGSFTMSSQIPSSLRANGPMIRIWSSVAPVLIVHGTKDPITEHDQWTVAHRIATDAFTYQRINVDVVDDITALGMIAEGATDLGNLILIGNAAQNAVVSHLSMEQAQPPVQFFSENAFSVAGRVFDEPETGIIYLRPHPTTPTGLVCIIAGNDLPGLELAVRLIPIRTGVPIPGWTIVGPESRHRGAGGFLGAGFWTNEWELSREMSYFA